MAIGFTPKYIKDFPVNDLSPRQFLVLAHETSVKIGWKVSYVSEAGIIAYTDNGMFSRNAEIKIKIENGIGNIQSVSTGSEMIDWGKNKENVEDFLDGFAVLKKSLNQEELEERYQELKENIVSQGDSLLNLPPATTTEQITGFFSIFKPRKDFFVTPILIDLNILIFILMVVSSVSFLLPDNQSLLNWGANFRPLTLEGEWWRLITNCFLHIGIVHLLMNMYALLYIGVLLEPHLGRLKFISAYLLTGIMASVASLWWNELTISAGASGAIFGMYGVFLAMLTTDLIEKKARKALLTSIGIFVGYNLIYGLKGGIDNAAHIGGLLSGLVIGYAFIPSLKKPNERQWTFGTVGLLSVIIIGLSFIIYQKIPNDIGVYDQKMKQFAAIEEKALAVFSLPANTPNDKILAEINNRGLTYWNQDLKLVQSFEDLNLPPVLKTQNQLLKAYCELRIKSYKLLYKAISENTNQYQSQIEDYNQQIEALISEISGKKQSQ